MSFLLLKALHLIAGIAWFAGLFYLPRLFVYHAMTDDTLGDERFKIMERKLYRGIMTPAAIATLLCGAGMLYKNPALLEQAWMQIKLFLILLLVIYHLACGRMARAFAENRNLRSHIFYRWFNEVPVLFLIGIVMLAVLRPW